jgi:hypothetical protein
MSKSAQSSVTILIWIPIFFIPDLSYLLPASRTYTSPDLCSDAQRWNASRRVQICPTSSPNSLHRNSTGSTFLRANSSRRTRQYPVVTLSVSGGLLPVVNPRFANQARALRRLFRSEITPDINPGAPSTENGIETEIARIYSQFREYPRPLLPRTPTRTNIQGIAMYRSRDATP